MNNKQRLRIVNLEFSFSLNGKQAHASPAHQLTRVSNKYYSQHAELRVLTVDPTRLTAELKWEIISTGDQYPHIYGPLNMDAVTSVSTVARQADGSYEISV